VTLWERIRGWFSPPVFEDDEDKTRVARALHALWLTLAVVTVGLIVMLFTVVAAKGATAVIVVSMGAVLVVSRVLVLRGRVQGASGLFLGFLGIIFVAAIVLSGGASSPALFLYFVLVVMAAMLLGERVALVAAVLIALLSPC